VKISCPTCAAKYSVADEKIQSRLAKIRCRKCSATIVIDGMTTPASVYIGDPGAPLASGPPPQDAAGDGVGARPSGASPSGPAVAVSPAAAAAAPAGPATASALTSAMAPDPLGPAADEYAVDIADNDQRNMTIHQIVGAYNEGLITADTYIWKEGMADWQTLAEVKAVADAIQAAARPVAPAAVRRAEQGSGPDLFGRIATAGGEDDISTSAPEPTFSAGTGARNESSVLFSLSALTGSTEAAAAPAGGGKSGRKNSEDSGLIDLTALTASDASAGGGLGASASAYGASPLISAPLGGVSGPSLGAGLAPGYGAPRSSGRTLIVAASVLAVAILGGAGLLVLNRGGGDAEPTTPLAEPAAAAAGTQKREPEAVAARPPEPTKEKETETASVKEDTVNADELPAAPEPVAKPVAARPAAPKPKPAPAPAPAPVRAKPAPAPAPEPVAAPPKPAAEAPKKPAGPRCDCKPADLMCAMRCSAKK